MSRRTIRNKGIIAAARLQRPPAPGERLAFRVDPWTRKLIRPLMISLLAVSFAVALLVIARTLSPETAWMALIPLCFLVALEGTYTSAWLNNPDSNGVDRLSYRAAEVFLILVIARAYSWGPKILGTAIVLSAMAMIAIVPRSLAQRWRTPTE